MTEEIDLFGSSFGGPGRRAPSPPRGKEPVGREEPKVYSIKEITQEVRRLLEQGLGTVWVEGEVSNLRKQPSGHQYFTLKDESSQLACVWFARPGLWRKEVDLRDGMHVQVRGPVSVYEARGQYQLSVQHVQVAGAGALQAKFEALKRRLAEEGLFDSARKRALPAIPKCVALITSSSGAALQDMLNVLTRRAPWVRVLIFPVRVQGDGAAREIALAVQDLNQWVAEGCLHVDLLVVARGGGSIEDLWAFNEEVLARALVASRIPTVSAVGHEIDFTIADFAADLRAPTPSAAAELIVPDTSQLLRVLETRRERFIFAVQRAMERARNRLTLLASAHLFREPRVRLDAAAQRLDYAASGLERALSSRIQDARQRLAAARGILREHRPDLVLAHKRQVLERLEDRLQRACGDCVRAGRKKLDSLTTMLRLLGPAATLARGYTLTTHQDGSLVSSAAALPPGTQIQTIFADGKVASEVIREG